MKSERSSTVLRQRIRDFFDELGSSNLCKVLGIAGLVLYVLYVFLSSNFFSQSSEYLSSHVHNWHERNIRSRIGAVPSKASNSSTTNITHIVFGIGGSIKNWRAREPYINLWWQPNKTRGFVWLDRAPGNHLWPSSSPPFRVSEDVRQLHGMPYAIRIARVVLEAFRANNEGVRWYVMTDDDTVLFVNNLVQLLAKYDHNKYFYIGGNSECISQNWDHSYTMAFGGAGFAISFPLAKALVRILDGCLKRYQNLYGSDQIIQSCISELGVSVTRELGFHQIDLHGDVSGFLSAHPQAPLISLHHIDNIDPIFPSMNRLESLKRLMNASNADSSRLLQPAICYNKQFNWSISISWGYSAQIYERIHPPVYLHRPLQTFLPWRGNVVKPPFVFNVRLPSRDPCEVPHQFFFESIHVSHGHQIVTNYVRRSPWRLPTCILSGNHSADMVTKIQVFSSMKNLKWDGERRECCEIMPLIKMTDTGVRVRPCMDDEALVG